MARRRSRRRRKSSSSTSHAPESQSEEVTLSMAKDYYYVITDLRRMAIVAGALVLGLVILSFVL